MRKKFRRIIVTVMMLTLMIPSAWTGNVLAEDQNTKKADDNLPAFTAEGNATEESEGGDDNFKTEEASDNEEAMPQEKQIDVDNESIETKSSSDDPAVSKESSDENTEEESAGNSDKSETDEPEAVPEEAQQEAAEVISDTEKAEEADKAQDAEESQKEKADAETTPERMTEEESGKAGDQLKEQTEEISTEEERPEKKSQKDTDQPDMPEETVESEPDETPFKAVRRDYLAYDPLYIMKYADSDYVNVSEIDMSRFYNIVTSAKGVATYNVRKQADFDVTAKNYIAGLTYEMPVYDIDPKSKYYLALPDVNMFNGNFKAYDLMVAYNNDQAEMISGYHFKNGILYIPKKSIDHPSNQHPASEGNLIAVQMNYAIGGDMDFSKSIPVQILSKEEPADKTVTVSNIFDRDNLAVDTGVKNRKAEDIHVLLNGSMIPISRNGWVYDKSTGVVSIREYPGVISCINIVFESRTAGEKAEDIATSVIGSITPKAYAARVSQSDMRFFKTENGKEVILNIPADKLFVGWRGYYNGQVYWAKSVARHKERYAVLAAKRGWKNSVKYLYGGYDSTTYLDDSMSGSYINKHLAATWAFSSYAVAQDISLGSHEGDALTETKKVSHWNPKTDKTESMTIYEWLLEFRNYLEKAEENYGIEGNSQKANGIGGVNNFGFTFPKKVKGAPTSLVSEGNNKNAKNQSFTIESDEIEAASGSGDTSNYYDYWIAASCNHLGEDAEGEAGTSAVYVTCLGVGSDYAVLAFVQVGDNNNQNACAVYKFRTATGVSVKIKKGVNNSSDIAGSSEYSVKGSVFKLYLTEADAKADDDAVASFTISSDGLSGTSNTVEDIAAGRYYLVETKAGKGLTIPSSYKAANGGKRITLTNEGTNDIPLVNGTLVISVDNNYESIDVKVKKSIKNGDLLKNNDNYSVKGSTFKLYKTEDDARNNTGSAATFTIDSDGISGTSNKVEGLPAGSYYLVETKAGKGLTIPSSYKAANGGKKITLTDEGTNDIPLVNGALVISVDNDYEGIDVKVKKSIKNGDLLKNNDNYSVKGSTFKLYKTEDDARNNTGSAATFTIDSDGISGTSNKVEGLPAGSYYLVETKAGKGLTIPSSYKASNGGKKVTLDTNGTSTVPLVNNALEISAENDIETAHVCLKKHAAKTYYDLIKQCPAYYSLSGAEYRLYTDQACTKTAKDINNKDAVLTTTSDGSTNTLEMFLGTYYVKEIKASKGFELDSKPNDGKAVVLDKSFSGDSPYLITSTEIPKRAYLMLKKTSVKIYFDVLKECPDQYSLADAEYRLYTDSTCTKAAKDFGGNDAVLKTKADGSTNILEVIPGSYYVKEIKASKGFRIDSKPNGGKAAAVTLENTAGSPAVVTSEETPIPAHVKLTKKAAKTDTEFLREAPCNYTLEGAVYKLYTDSSCTKPAKDFTGKEAVMTTNKAGETPVLEMLPKTYYVKETTAPKGFMLDKTTGTVTATLQNNKNNPATFNATDNPTYGELFKLRKIDKSGKDGWKRLIGAKYRISYYDIDPSVADVTGKTPRRSWTFETSKKINEETNETYAGIDFRSDQPVKGNAFYTESNRRIMPIGVYTLEEIEAPAGLARDETVYINKVFQPSNGAEAKNSINVNIGNDLTFEAGSDSNVINHEKPQSIIIAIDKKDAETNENTAQGLESETRKSVFGSLAGAEFDVFFDDPRRAEPVRIGTIVTDENGHGELSADAEGEALELGRYYVKEVRAPAGYTPDSLSMSDEKGSYEDGRHVVSARAAEINTGTFTYSIESLEKPHHTVISKTDITTGKELPGAQMQVLDSKGNVVEEWTSGEKPHDIVALHDETQGLKDGKYILREITAPYGYDTAEDVEFEVKSGAIENTVVMKNAPVIIRTTASDNETGSHAGIASAEEKIKDTVRFENLYAGRTYTFKGILMDKDTGEALMDAGGKPVESEPVDYTVEGEKGTLVSGEVEIEFTVDTSGFTGTKSIVAFETVSRDDKELQIHADLKDKDQTIWFGGIASTVAVDKNSKSHNVLAAEKCVITDTVKYENLAPGETYKIEGEFFDKTTGKMTGCSRSLLFTPDKQDGTVDVDFSLDTSGLEGHALVAYETLYVIPRDDEGKEKEPVAISKHENPDDEEQTVCVPKFRTTAQGGTTGEHIIPAEQEAVIKDTVKYENLIPGKEYTVKGKMVYKENGNDVIADGKTVTAEAVFTPEEYTGEVVLTFRFNASPAAGKKIVAFEQVYEGENLIGVHADIDDEEQTVRIPKIGTNAIDPKTGEHVAADIDRLTIIDTVRYEKLIPGRDYVMRGKLVSKETGSEIKLSGKPVTAEKKFTAKAEDGEIKLEFTVLRKDYEGDAAVAFEECYIIAEGGNEFLIGEHKDLKDEGQTVHIPEIGTTAVDSETLDHISCGDKKITIIDTVTYKNLAPGKEYTVSGMLMDKNTGKPVKADGAEVTASAKFTPKKPDGKIDIRFKFDGRKLRGNTVIAYEYLKHEDVLVAAHTDINDEGQSVVIPGIGTIASDSVTGDHIAAAEDEITIIDTVEYENLIPGREYLIKGVLMSKEKGRPFRSKGKKITAKNRFTPEKGSGETSLEFNISGDGFDGKTAVAFEEIYLNGVLVGDHRDIDDEEQSVRFPLIRTTAVDSETGNHISGGGSNVEIIDTVEYKNFMPGKEYLVTGVLIDKSTGDVVEEKDDSTASAVRFTPAEQDGAVDIRFKIDATELSGKKVVAFEYAYYEDQLIAVHADYNDDQQTVQIGKPPASSPKTGDDNIIPVYLVLIALSAVSLILMVRKQRRR